MKTWTVNEAQSHFFEILKSSAQELQIIAAQGEPVAALVDIALLQELMAFQHRPTIADLLAELQEIQAESPVELELPDRQNRPNSFIEIN